MRSLHYNRAFINNLILFVKRIIRHKPRNAVRVCGGKAEASVAIMSLELVKETVRAGRVLNACANIIQKRVFSNSCPTKEKQTSDER